MIKKDLSTEKLEKLINYLCENKKTPDNGKFFCYDNLIKDFSVSEEYIDFLVKNLKKVGLIDYCERFAKREFRIY